MVEKKDDFAAQRMVYRLVEKLVEEMVQIEAKLMVERMAAK